MVAEYIVAGLLVVAGVFGLVGSWGLLKLDHPMKRLHAPTKAATVGLGAVLVASMLYGAAFDGQIGWHALLVTLFLLLTAPITANFLGKVHIHRAERPETLPPTGTEAPWATFDRPRREPPRET